MLDCGSTVGGDTGTVEIIYTYEIIYSEERVSLPSNELFGLLAPKGSQHRLVPRERGCGTVGSHPWACLLSALPLLLAPRRLSASRLARVVARRGGGKNERLSPASGADSGPASGRRA